MLFGHAEAEQTLLDAYRGGRMPHAWLIGGPPGIGKATLAYRMARFVLAHPDPRRPQCAGRDLARGCRPTIRSRGGSRRRRIATCWCWSASINEKTGKLCTVIRVDDVRRTVPFFGSTAGEGGWRVCIVDTADELQDPQGANALLKILEEPPANALLLLVSHAPARLLPTIRSRCRRLTLRPLSPSDVARAPPTRSAAMPTMPSCARPRRCRTAASGARLTLLEGPALRAARAGDRRCSTVCRRSIRARCMRSATRSAAPSRSGSRPSSTPSTTGWRRARRTARRTLAGMVRIAEAWEQSTRRRATPTSYNLERKPLVFTVFGWLAEAARG